MKLYVNCNQCINNFIEAGGKNLRLLSLAGLTISDNGIYEFKCPRGHESVTTLSAERFEILFEIGANAVIDGYYREAVSSFTSSLERFYEYFISISSIKNKVSEDKFNDAWKHISNQSERQNGAFVFTWLLETGSPPSQLSSKWREFRNAVIHKGKIPTEVEAINFGEEILRLLHEGIDLVISKYDEYRAEIMGRAARDFPHEKYKGHVIGGMGIATIASLTYRGPRKTFQEGLASLNQQRNLTQIYQLLGLTGPSGPTT